MISLIVNPPFLLPVSKLPNEAERSRICSIPAYQICQTGKSADLIRRNRKMNHARSGAGGRFDTRGLADLIHE